MLRLLTVLLVGLFALTIFAGSRSAAASTPVHLVLFVPSDTDLDVAAAAQIVEAWGADTNAWFRREVGRQVDVDFIVIHSTQTRYQLASGNVDACGDGASDFRVRHEVHAVLGIPDGTSKRLWIVMLGAGGWAGGNYFKVQRNQSYGYALVGDWGLRYALTGQFSPCDPYRDASNPNRVFGHELLHSMGVDSHNPVVFLGDPLSATQRRDLWRLNKEFLR
jgi:hypothetical protein